MPEAPNYLIQKNLVEDSVMVVSPHPLASEIGRDILRAGGNAIDAAVAVQYAIAVVYPRAGNLGGGGFMVIRQANGENAAIDYREKAPSKASRDMYLDSLGNVIPDLSTEGHLAAGVPGTVSGLIAVHEKYGKLDLRQLIEPAIKLAAEGFSITETEASRLNRFQEAFQKYNGPDCPFVKGNWQAGEVLKQTKLAQTLERIRDQGKAGFYAGPTAEAILTEMQQGNGIISLEDLQGYEARWRTPLVRPYKDYQVISMPPSSSGGVALLQMLEMIEPYPISTYGFHSVEAVHLMAEIERRVYADRAEHLGDTDFFDVPIDTLLSKNYLTNRMADFSPDSATVSASIHAGNFTIGLESFETTHTSVVDLEGNAVSVTTTLNSNFGSKVWVDEGGFFLNNEMDDFSVKPGVPNQFGLVGAEANAIAPNKRMLSSMTPTIIEKNGDLFMVLGSPGGSTIITAVFQVFINVAEFGMSLDQAVNVKRFHHQWLPDQILMEEGTLDTATQEALAAKGHQFHEVGAIAVVKAIQKLPDGRLQGVGDARNADDDAKGF
ncbi:MAG: gamma-glutamyltransferase [Saprospiraceae bacterium]|nr:MAG: gamma-glutamyltransferase [Saprospiraceae bacterium]